MTEKAATRWSLGWRLVTMWTVKTHHCWKPCQREIHSLIIPDDSQRRACYPNWLMLTLIMIEQDWGMFDLKNTTVTNATLQTWKDLVCRYIHNPLVITYGLDSYTHYSHTNSCTSTFNYKSILLFFLKCCYHKQMNVCSHHGAYTLSMYICFTFSV